MSGSCGDVFSFGLKVIAGLELMDTMEEETTGGINPRISTGRGFTIVPLSENGGSLVTLGNIPVFKVVSQSITGQSAFTSPALFSKLFSPTIYADGKVFNSLGELIIVSAAIFFAILALFLTRKRILRKILRRKNPKIALGAYTVFLTLLLAGVIAYIHFIFIILIIII